MQVEKTLTVKSLSATPGALGVAGIEVLAGAGEVSLLFEVPQDSTLRVGSTVQLTIVTEEP